MNQLLAALWRHLRNGDVRPTPFATSGCVSPSLSTPTLVPVGEGDGSVTSCSQGCGRPGTCTWECDGELYRVCTVCCGYCNPGGDLDGELRRRRMQIGTVIVP